MPRHLAVWLLGLLLLSTPALALEMGIVTGNPEGTYYQIGVDIRKLVSRYDINLNVRPSAGSIANVHSIYKEPGVQLGIVQSDVLAFIQQVSDNQELKPIAQKTKMVFPLYNEEVHLLALSDIKQFADLEGKTVAVGPENSGTYMTASFLFHLSEIKPKQLRTIGGREAIEALKKGQIDAMFYVAGHPIALLQQSVSTDDKLHLVPITHKSLTEFYPTSQIPAGTYGWQAEDIETIAVKAVLISFDYKGENCGNVGLLAKILAENLDWLQQNGHPKWKTVDFGNSLKKWEQYGCVRQALASGARISSGTKADDPILEALRKQLGK